MLFVYVIRREIRLKVFLEMYRTYTTTVVSHFRNFVFSGNFLYVNHLGSEHTVLWLLIRPRVYRKYGKIAYKFSTYN